ncbi:MAG: sugar phosphate isomerase/epimerase family protein [Armatimonas sp.]
MRFGVCAGLEQVPALAEAGFDYFEPGVVSALMPLSSTTEWQAMRARLEAMPLRPEAFNMFVPASLKIVGPNVDPHALGKYAFTALERAKQVGGEVIVLGSGGARSIPEGYPYERAYAELKRFLHQCADAGEKFDVKVAVEPLGVECSFITSVDEGAALVREVARVAIGNLADTWHMQGIAEPLSAIEQSADILIHTHSAGPGRKAPGADYDFSPVMTVLKAAGYNGRLSLENGWDDLTAQAPAALQALKSAI